MLFKHRVSLRFGIRVRLFVTSNGLGSESFTLHCSELFVDMAKTMSASQRKKAAQKRANDKKAAKKSMANRPKQHSTACLAELAARERAKRVAPCQLAAPKEPVDRPSAKRRLDLGEFLGIVKAEVEEDLSTELEQSGVVYHGGGGCHPCP